MTKNFLENINKFTFILVLLGLTSHTLSQQILPCDTLTLQTDQDSLKHVKDKLANGIKDISINEE